MSSITLISVVGGYGQDYTETAYEFPSGRHHQVRYFGYALLQELRSAQQPAPDRWIVIGTPTSGWDQLRFCVPASSPRHSSIEDVAAEVCETLSDGKPISREHLDRMGALLSEELGITVDLRTTTDEGDDIFAALHDDLPQDSEVEVDITHGYRTMPAHMLIALGALRWIKGIRVRGIHYGKEARRPRRPECPHCGKPPGTAPARNAADGAPSRGTALRLEQLSLMARATPALASLDLRGDLRDIADVLDADPALRPAKKPLRDTQRLAELMQYDNSARAAARAKGPLNSAVSASDTDISTFMRACATRTLDALNELGASSGSMGVVERSKAALKRKDYLRAIALAYEALIMCVMVAEKLDSVTDFESRKKKVAARLEEAVLREGAPRFNHEGQLQSAERAYHTLRMCRNSVMHADTAPRNGKSKGKKKVLQSALLDEKRLESVIAWAHKMHDFIMTTSPDASASSQP